MTEGPVNSGLSVLPYFLCVWIYMSANKAHWLF